MARNGQDGYEKALKYNTPLILTDIAMPIMDGLEMANKILEEMPETKFIFMSCYDDTAYIRESMNHNAYGYLLKPINLEKLVETVKKMLKVKQNETEIVENMQQLKQTVKESVPYVREMVTRDIIYGNLESAYLSQLESINMNVKKLYSIVVVRVKDVDMDIELNCRIVHDIRRCMEERIPQDMRSCSFLQNRRSFVMIVYLDDEDNETIALDKLFDFLNDTKEYINNEFRQNVIICTSELLSNINDAAEAYNSIEYTLKTNIYEMGNGVILAEKQTSATSIMDYDIINLKQEITDIFAEEDFGRMQDFLDKYYREDKYNKNSLRAFTYTLISILQLLLLERNESFGSVFGDDISIWNKLSDYNTIFDIRQWIINIFRFSHDYIYGKNNSGGQRAELINNIKNIINEEYGSIENISQIAGKVYISASYANYVFKLHEGITIFEYLVQVRLEKAKFMLKNTNMKIYEISEKIGYTSKTYFASLFKEYTGMTPKNYRNNA